MTTTKAITATMILNPWDPFTLSDRDCEIGDFHLMFIFIKCKNHINFTKKRPFAFRSRSLLTNP